MRKLLALCLIALMSAALTGCDPKPQNTDAVPPPPNKDELMKQYGKGGKGQGGTAVPGTPAAPAK